MYMYIYIYINYYIYIYKYYPWLCNVLYYLIVSYHLISLKHCFWQLLLARVSSVYYRGNGMGLVLNQYVASGNETCVLGNPPFILDFPGYQPPFISWISHMSYGFLMVFQQFVPLKTSMVYSHALVVTSTSCGDGRDGNNRPGKHTKKRWKITIFHGKITIFHGKITICHGKITICHGKIQNNYGKIHPCSMGKSTISTGPFSIAMLNIVKIPEGISYWLVVYLPLWKIWVRQLGWWHSQYDWKNNPNVPNHQPAYYWWLYPILGDYDHQ